MTLPARSVIIASGVTYRTIDATGLDRFGGMGVFYFREVGGTQRLERVRVEDVVSGASETLSAAALFVLVGAVPHTEWLAQGVRLDRAGYIVTGADLGRQARTQPPWLDLGRDPYLLETSVPGVLAAGDVRSGSVKRGAAAVGEGSIAVRFVSEYLGRRSAVAEQRRS